MFFRSNYSLIHGLTHSCSKLSVPVVQDPHTFVPFCRLRMPDLLNTLFIPHPFPSCQSVPFCSTSSVFRSGSAVPVLASFTPESNPSRRKIYIYYIFVYYILYIVIGIIKQAQVHSHARSRSLSLVIVHRYRFRQPFPCVLRVQILHRIVWRDHDLLLITIIKIVLTEKDPVRR